MHIPDGLMDPIIFGAGWLVTIIVIFISLKIVNKKIDNKQIPLMAILAAGIFVGQMLNFPVGGGTSGHLVGAVMAAVFLGPFAGMIVITAIIVIQCLLFGDGGITAMGLNIFNMGIIGCLIGWYVHRIFPERHRNMGIFVASWLAIFLGALSCSAQLSLSYSLSGGVYGISGTIAFPAMLGYHAIIGIGEALITVGIVTFVAHVSPDMLKIPKIMPGRAGKEVGMNVT